MDHVDDLTVTVRTARIVYRLMRGQRYTTAQVAAITGLTHNGAYRLMTRISGELPVWQSGNYWVICEGEIVNKQAWGHIE